MNKALPLLALLLAGCGNAGTPLSGGGAVADAPPGFPDALKNDAFEYYGLGNTKPMKLEVVQGEGGYRAPATRTLVPGKVEGDKATFVLKQEGGLADEGDITLSLEKDGLYAMSSTRNKLTPHTLELPARLAPGGDWKDHTEMKQGESQIVLDSVLKIVGTERIATPGGTFDDALHVVGSGSGKSGPEEVVLKTESWYVRGLGPVKQVVEFTPKAGGPKRSVTVQLAAPDAPAGGAGPDLGGSSATPPMPEGAPSAPPPMGGAKK